MTAGVLLLLSVLTAAPVVAEQREGGLERARELFRQNRWAEAREVIRSVLDGLPEKERDQARLLVGLSLFKEGELYRGLSLFAAGVGLDYLKELAASEENRGSKWLPLFLGLYSLADGNLTEAERALEEAGSSTTLDERWRELARLRLTVARYLSGQRREADALSSDEGPEARYWTSVLAGDRARPDVLEALLADDLDAPDVEDASEPEKVLRFFDPLTLSLLERTAWERSLQELVPLAEEGAGMANKLARFYAGLSLFFLGDTDGASTMLRPIDPKALGPVFFNRVRLVNAAATWTESPPTSEEVASLWEQTAHYPEVVLLWMEVERPELREVEPFAGRLRGRLETLPGSWGERADESMVGRWGLAAIASGVDSGEVLRTLSVHRNHANKNKIEWNDPLLLVALSAANYGNNDYAQALETLFELSKSFDGLRGLQWNLQGVYAARQKSAGAARIAN